MLIKRLSEESLELLTPRHLFLQLEPSWFFRGQTTSLLESERGKDEVNDDRGGILAPPCAARRLVGGECVTADVAIKISDD